MTVTTANSHVSTVVQAKDVHKHVNDHGQSTGPPKTRVFYVEQPPLVKDLIEICDRTVDPSLYPLASSFPKNIAVYSMTDFAGKHDDVDLVEQLKDEWNHILAYGPGVCVLKGLYRVDGLESVVDTANGVFDRILKDEHAAFNLSQRKDTSEVGKMLDKNLKAANVFSQLAKRDPNTFMRYYSNPWLRYMAEAWLGPGYRFNSSLNIVPPGGEAQRAHRDYHMGFYDAVNCAKFPRLVQTANQILTLQGAIAHSDMPLASGPTRFMPFSQLFEEGYMAGRRPEFQEHFSTNYVSVALEKGDGVFFNPSLYHAAGENTTTDVYRNAQLLQINSNFGKPSEFLNSIPVIRSCWDLLVEEYQKHGLNTHLQALIAAIGDGYPSPQPWTVLLPALGTSLL